MSFRQSGLNPLGYMGVEPVSVSADVAYNRAPTSTDSQNFNLLTRWLDTSNQSVWILVSLSAGVATWVEITTGGMGTVLSLTGNSGGAVMADGGGNINVVGDGTTIDIVGNPGTNTLTVSAVGTGLIQTLTGDAGGAVPPTAGNINIAGATTLPECGAVFTGNPGTSTLTLSFRLFNMPNADALGGGIYYYSNSTFMHNFGTQNTFLGEASGNVTLTTASANIGIGLNALSDLTTGDSNVCIGNLSGDVMTSGTQNASLGFGTLFSTTTGSNNTATGFNALTSLVTGSNNTAVGINAGSSYTAAEASNIVIGNTGTAAESNTIRIGTQGNGAAQQNRAFMAGVYNTTPGSGTTLPVIIDLNGQLGTGAVGDLSSVVTQVFTSSGTYTPTAGMKYCIIECIGAGGGGAGAVSPGAGNGSCGMGGGAGGYARKTVSAATIGVSQAVTIGAGGAGGANTGSNGVAGGTTSVGAIVSATGGDFGLGTGAFGAGWIFAAATDGTGGTGVGGDVNTTGNAGDIGFGLGASFTLGGRGGASFFGGFAKTNSCVGSAAPGFAGVTYGAGGGGAACQNNVGGAVGGAGADGIVIITEFVG